MSKVCSKCHYVKELTSFSKSKQTKSGFHSYCKLCSAISKRNWSNTNKAHEKQMAANYYRLNKTIIVTKIVKRQAMRRKTNVQERIKHALRKRFTIAVKKNYKSGLAVRNLGCSIEEFKEYIESKFEPGMTWANYGLGQDKWQMDHIKPLYKFDLTNLEQLKDACNFKNIQPLWYQDHLNKTRNDVYGNE